MTEPSNVWVRQNFGVANTVRDRDRMTNVHVINRRLTWFDYVNRIGHWNCVRFDCDGLGYRKRMLPSFCVFRPYVSLLFSCFFNAVRQPKWLLSLCQSTPIWWRKSIQFSCSPMLRTWMKRKETETKKNEITCEIICIERLLKQTLLLKLRKSNMFNLNMRKKEEEEAREKNGQHEN